MSFHLPFGNLTDSELPPFIKNHDTPPFSQCTYLVIQPPTSSDGHDEFYNPDSQLNDNFKCGNFDLDNEDFEKISTSTAPKSCLTIASLNIRSVSKNFETFHMDINKLKFYILVL